MPLETIATPVEDDALTVHFENEPDAVASALTSARQLWSVGRDVRALRRALLAILAALDES